MANQVNSEAHFRARALEYGLHEDILAALLAQNIKTMGALAFAIFRPGQDFDDNTFNNWARDLNNGVLPPMGSMSALRRLHFESEVILTSTLRASVESVDSSEPKSLPFAERATRMQQLRTRLTGISIHGQGEPSHSLVEEMCHQYESRCLKHVEASRCTSRENEIQAGKSDKKIKLDSGTLALKETRAVPDESISTTWHFAQCMRRRALAYEFANLITFERHERYTEQLIRHLNIEPPPGFHATSLIQVLRADKEVWSFLARSVQDIRPDGAGVRPLDTALDDALKDYNTTFHLLPLPKSNADTTQSKAGKHDSPQSGNSAQWSNPGGWNSNAAGSNFKGGKKGRGKGKGASNAPRGYPGCVGRDAKNRPICFDYNVAECSKAPGGGTCPKGRHVCFKAGCFKVHQYKTAHGEGQKTNE